MSCMCTYAELLQAVKQISPQLYDQPLLWETDILDFVRQREL